METTEPQMTILSDHILNDLITTLKEAFTKVKYVFNTIDTIQPFNTRFDVKQLGEIAVYNTLIQKECKEIEELNDFLMERRGYE